MKTAMVAVLCLAASAHLAQGALVYSSGSFEIRTSAGPEFIAGDIFDFNFSYDDSILDSADFSTDIGWFSPALLSLTLAADPGNLGTWDPSGGTFTVPADIVTSVPLSRVEFSVPGAGFPTFNAQPFVQLEFYIAVPSVTDTANYQSLSQHLGGLLTWDSNGTGEVVFRFGGLGNTGVADLVSLDSTDVPEPGTWEFAFAGLALCTAARILHRKRLA